MNLRFTDTIKMVFKLIWRTSIVFLLVINLAFGNTEIDGKTKDPDPTEKSDELQRRITGQITDENGEALPGATILEKGTSNGTITDVSGNFSLSVQDENAVLQVSFVGYTTLEETVGSKSTINVSLEPDQEQLDEVVVMGYGTQKKRDLTGAVGQIDATKIANQSPNSVTDILRANVPGLNVGFNNSPKGVSEIQVRGNNSLNAGTQPLIVLDGTIYNGDLSSINPNDIDKIDVMKDASSAAVYGARGANGVILITTKRGTSEKPTINVATSYGIASKAFDNPPYSPQGYANWRTDVFKSINYGVSGQPGYFDNPDNLPAGVNLSDWLAYDGATGDPTTAWLNRIGFQDVEIGNYLAGRSVDWYDQIFQNGTRSDLNLSLSGQKSDLKYFWSINKMSNEGIIVGEKFETIRTRLNLDAEVVDWLSVGVNAQFS